MIESLEIPGHVLLGASVLVPALLGTVALIWNLRREIAPEKPREDAGLLVHYTPEEVTPLPNGFHVKYKPVEEKPPGPPRPTRVQVWVDGELVYIGPERRASVRQPTHKATPKRVNIDEFEARRRREHARRYLVELESEELDAAADEDITRLYVEGARAAVSEADHED